MAPLESLVSFQLGGPLVARVCRASLTCVSAHAGEFLVTSGHHFPQFQSGDGDEDELSLAMELVLKSWRGAF